MTDIMIHGGLGGGEGDERAVAKAQLEATEELLRSLCASHAATFVSVERRGQALEAALRDLLSSVKVVETQVSTAKNALEQEEESEKSLAALSEKHRVRRRTLLQHSSLLELLELPSLMDACVRSNLYEEALSISAFANTLERRHTEKNDVVLKVIAQIRSRQSDLRRHLLHSLKNYVTMPQCLEIVTALRRLNSIDLERQSESNLERVHAAMELSLQVDFLEARDAWLDLPSGASSAPGSSSVLRSPQVQMRSSEDLLDVIERYRTRVFEIATQFNAIFRAQTTPSSQQVSVSLLSMWISRRVHSFLAMLTVQMNRMEDSAAVRDAFDSCVFFAASLGRLGADFTAQLPPIFEHKMHDLVVHYWKEGTNQLSETLRVCRDAGVASPLFSSSVDTTAFSQGEMSTGGGPLPPPRPLMAHPPLARFVNSFVTGLNELRRCLLPGIFSHLRKSCDELMKELRDMLQTNERAVMKPGLRGDAEQLRKVAAEMKQVLTAIVDPYIRGALEYALGNEKGAAEFHELLKETKEEDVVEEETAEEVAGEALEEKEGEGSDEGDGGSAQELTDGADERSHLESE